MAGRRVKKQPMSFMKKIVIFCVILLMIFTIVCLIMAWRMAYEPATLIQWFYTIFGMELLVMAIKAILDGRGDK